MWRDESELRAGDSIVERITAALDEIEFVAALVSKTSVSSSWCQKELSLAMTGEIARRGVQVLPLRVDGTDMPPSLKDKLYVEISSNNVSEAVERLAASIQAHLQPVRQIPARRLRPSEPRRNPPEQAGDPVRVVGVDRDGLGTPRGDGTPGSALYLVPLVLSRTPSRAWAEAFTTYWNTGLFSTMHRPGIGSVRGDRIVLDGTTVDEVAQHHLVTVREAVARANEFEATQRARATADEQRRRELLERHDQEVDVAISRMRFED